MEQVIDIVYVLKSITLTIFFVGLIGFERQSKHKVAGITTHLLVALGAVTLSIIQQSLYTNSLQLMIDLQQQYPDMSIRIQPEQQRIIAQIVAGVGFLGTGTIIKTNGYISGLTTASSLWISAIIGIAFGLGHYTLGVIVSVFALGVLTIVKRIFKNLYIEEKALSEN